MSKARSGGGITMRHNREVGVKAGGPSTNKVSLDAVAHLGNMIGSHITDQGDILRRKYPLVTDKAAQVPSGNAKALELAGKAAGPGAGRNVYKTGSQSLYGKPVGSATPARDILSSYGPELTPSSSALKR